MTNRTLPTGNIKKQPRFFYGYFIVLGAFSILFIAGGSLYSFGVFFKPMLSEFGWTRAATSGPYSLNMIIMGICGILIGRLCDRFGPRIVLSICGLLIGLGYLLMSRVEAIWQIYLFYGVIVGIGMGGTTVPLLSTVTKWFIRRRGLAVGIAVSGFSVGMAVIPSLANILISNYGWRISFIILGLASFVLIVIFSQFMRNAQLGISAPVINGAGTENLKSQVREMTIRQAVVTAPFWIIFFMSLFLGFGAQMIVVHIIAHITDIGFSAAAATIVLSVIGLISIIGNVVMGIIGDRAGNRQAMIIIFILLTAAFLCLRFAGELWMIYFFALIYGLGYGGYTTVQSPLVADYFGLRIHGLIFGMATFAATIGASLGPLIAGWIFDIDGSYNWAFIICAVISITSLILSILLKPVRNSSVSRSSA